MIFFLNILNEKFRKKEVSEIKKKSIHKPIFLIILIAC